LRKRTGEPSDLPPFYLPGEVLRTAFDEAHGHAVSLETMDLGLRRIKAFVIDAAEALGPRLDAVYRDLIPWSAEHYMDENIPGSLTSEIPATAAYIEAIWARLHGGWPVTALVGHQYPDPPGRLLGVDTSSVDSWVTVVFGSGAIVGSLSADTVRLSDESGDAVPFDVAHTRWSGSRPESSTRLVQLRPSGELLYDHEYTVELGAGVTLQDGRVLAEPWRYAFRTPCAPESPCIEPDAAVPDAALPDAAVPDAVVLDAAAPDVTVDAAPDPESASSSGCSQGAPTPSPWWAFSVALSLGRRGKKAGTRRIRSA
jgi:hypothetical protein